MSTQPSTALEPNWAAFAALDWGAQNHSWSLLPAAGGPAESGKLANTPEAVELWAAALRQRFPQDPVAVAVEQKRGPVVYMLSKYEHLILYPVPPTMSAFYRRAFSPSGAKSDPGDAAMLLDLLVHHRERLRPRAHDTRETRLLQLLTEQRRQLVQQRVRGVQQLTASLEQDFPQVRAWFGAVDTQLVHAFLERWPGLPQLQHSHPGTVHRFLLQHHCRKEQLWEENCRAIYAAVPATTDDVIIETATRHTAAVLSLLRVLREQIAGIDKRIAELVADHPDAPIFASFPGAGAALVPRLIAAFGSRRDAWESAADMQCFSGIAPVHKSSGASAVVAMRRACPIFVRQTFHEFAGHSIRFSEWASLYYHYKRDQQKASHHTAIRSLAFRWIRILYRCWKDRQLYDERLFAAAQTRRNAPKADWNAAAGFRKLTER